MGTMFFATWIDYHKCCVVQICQIKQLLSSEKQCDRPIATTSIILSSVPTS